MTQTDLETVRALKALADETRFEIVRMLCRQPMCGGDLLERFSITQPTLSYHIKILTDSGLVVGVKEGAFIRYSLNRACFAQVRARFCGFCEPDEAKSVPHEFAEPTD